MCTTIQYYQNGGTLKLLYHSNLFKAQDKLTSYYKISSWFNFTAHGLLQ